ncbi:MAG: mechanosensitive ion channel family protein, partial [Phycisphaeraceae bacterium]|nr:mechanosensitive ion channel family protein [Phycisphaeraceae bacterium]
MGNTSLFQNNTLIFIAGIVSLAIFLQMLFNYILNTSIEFLDGQTKLEIQNQKTIALRRASKVIILLLNVAITIFLGYGIIINKGEIPGPLQNIIFGYGKIILYGLVAIIAYKLIYNIIVLAIKAVITHSPLQDALSTRLESRRQSLYSSIKYVLIFIVSTYFVYGVLTTFGLDMKALLATAGIASLAVGFGAQNLVKDFFNGFFILLEDSYGIGDVVMINGIGGFVESMTLRITRLRNTEGCLITIPHSEVTTVINFTKEWSRLDFKIGVDYDTDILKALSAMKEELEELKKIMSKEILDPPGTPPEVLSLESFDDNQIT